MSRLRSSVSLIPSNELLVAAILALSVFPSVAYSQGGADEALSGTFSVNGMSLRLSIMHTYTSPNAEGTTVFFNDRQKQLPEQFIPFDPRRGAGREISWITDTTEGATTSGLSEFGTSAAIRRAMSTWDDVKSTHIPLQDFGDVPFDLGVVQFLLSGGAQGFLGVAADITHAGFLPKGFFDLLGPGGGDVILAVTFGFAFVDDEGEFTDVNGDGKFDVAFREIYYNDGFLWGIDASAFPVYDVQTVALHEAGHGLSQDHFGKAFRTAPNGKLHFSPRAVMNSAYSGLQQSLRGTDIAGHSSIWGSWPR